jgi:DNA-binding MurR/RpiR family transcriptional regulator
MSVLALDSPMTDGLRELETTLRELLPAASGQAAKAIRFILANRDQIPLRSMRELAKRAGIAPVAFVRIAQRAGYPGFEELREIYADAVTSQSQRNRSQATRLMSLARQEGSLGFAARFVERELEIQQQTLAGLTEAQLTAAVGDIVAAERVFVAGRRPLFPAAFAFAYALRKVKSGTELLDTGGGMATELGGLSPKDAFVGFSFHPYSRITLSFAEQAAAQQATIIAITDSPAAPIAKLARHVFITSVQGYAFPDSISGAQMIGSILVGLAVSTLGSAGLERISENEAQIKRTGEMMA